MSRDAVHWLLQDREEDRHETAMMADALSTFGARVHMVRLKGFSDEVPAIPDLPEDAPVVCYGASWVPRALSRPWTPGIWYDPETFRWSSFADAWDGLMLSGDGRLATLAEARKLLAEQGGHRFIRPDRDLKELDGGVYDSGSLEAALSEAWVRATGDTPVVVATPVEVLAEWRTFVVDGDIVAASEYRRAGRPSTQGFVPHRAVDFAYEAVDRWTPAPVFCLDIASDGERYGIVEANCFNAARFYAADGMRILEAVNGFAAGRRIPEAARGFAANR